ncbi:hypothetical protein IJ182_10460 [bacterium]|nr:hypothetical protein [bacterium]
MNISAINSSFTNYGVNNVLNNNRVSFSSKKRPINNNSELSESSKQGLNVAKKMIKLARVDSLTLDNVQQIINEQAPVPVKVDSINNLPSIVSQRIYSKVLAHMLPGYNYNFQLAQANIYISDNAKTAKEQGELIANTAHEFTHILQRNNDKNYFGILNYTRNPQEVTQIARTSQTVMQKALGECSSQLFGDSKKTQKIIYDRLSGKYNTKDNIKRTSLNEMIDNASLVLSQQLRKDKNDMKQAITGFIKQETQNEIEAYDVTIKTLDDWGKYTPEYKGKMLLSQDIHRYIYDSLN